MSKFGMHFYGMGGRLYTRNVQPTFRVYNQERIKPPKAAGGHATHTCVDGIVLNGTKFTIQILCSLHCVMGRSVRTIEVLRLSV